MELALTTQDKWLGHTYIEARKRKDPTAVRFNKSKIHVKKGYKGITTIKVAGTSAQYSNDTLTIESRHKFVIRHTEQRDRRDRNRQTRIKIQALNMTLVSEKSFLDQQLTYRSEQMEKVSTDYKGEILTDQKAKSKIRYQAQKHARKNRIVRKDKINKREQTGKK